MAEEIDDQPIEETETAGPEETVVESQGDDATQSLSDATLAAAQSYGLRPEDLSGLDDDGAQRLFAGIDRRMMSGQPAYAPGNGQPVHQQYPAQQQPQYQPPGQAQGIQKFELGDLSDFEEPIANTFKSIGEYVNNTVGGLSQQLQAANQQLADMNTAMEISAFDSFVASLGDEWVKELGKGSTLDLDAKSLEYGKRADLYRHGKALQESHYRTFGQVIPLADAWKRAWSGQYADRIGSQGRKQLSKNLKTRQSLITERPQRGEGPATSPYEAAVAAFRKT